MILVPFFFLVYVAAFIDRDFAVKLKMVSENCVENNQ